MGAWSSTVESEFESPWHLESLDDEWVASKLKGIVAFDIRIERMESTLRLMQNRPVEDRENVAVALASADDTNAQRVAALMRRYAFEDEL